MKNIKSKFNTNIYLLLYSNLERKVTPIVSNGILQDVISKTLFISNIRYECVRKLSNGLMKK